LFYLQYIAYLNLFNIQYIYSIPFKILYTWISNKIMYGKPTTPNQSGQDLKTETILSRVLAENCCSILHTLRLVLSLVSVSTICLQYRHHIRNKRHNGRQMSLLFILATSPVNFCLPRNILNWMEIHQLMLLRDTHENIQHFKYM